MDENPYEPATVSMASSGTRLSLWRILLGTFFLLLGLAVVTSIGTATVLELFFTVTGASPFFNLVFGAFWGLAGVLFLAASRFYWLGKYRNGNYASFVAFAAIALQLFFDG